jgi:hypothetical protein
MTRKLKNSSSIRKFVDSTIHSCTSSSPTITSTKWWIGMAGQVFSLLTDVVNVTIDKTATHTVALCKLIIDGEDCGLQWFVVPLRSQQDGRLLPGVTCGDIGAKAVMPSLQM